MTLQIITLEFDTSEVRTFGLHRMTHHLGPQAGFEWRAHMSNEFGQRDVHGQIVGDCWGHAVASTPEEAWAGAQEHLRSMVAQRLAQQNDRGPAQTKGLEPEVIVSKKGLEDMGL